MTMQWYTLALEAWEGMLLRVVILLVLIWLVLWLMNRHYRTEQEKRSEQLQKQYAVLTRATLDALPDEELTEAVIANLNAKQDKKQPDPYTTLPLLSHERVLVYAVWLIHQELDSGDFDTLFASPSRQFCEYAAEGLDECGAPECAAAIRRALGTSDEAELADCHASYVEAAEREHPTAGLIAYIRDNADALCDRETEDNGHEH